jgi:hypothetical protein
VHSDGSWLFILILKANTTVYAELLLIFLVVCVVCFMFLFCSFSFCVLLTPCLQCLWIVHSYLSMKMNTDHESNFISVTNFRLVCLLHIVAYTYVLSFLKKSKSKHYTKKATVGTGVDQIDTSVTTNTHKIVFEIAMLSAWHTNVIHNGNPE